MKKTISALFASMLALFVLICALAGCDHELLLHGTGLPTTLPPVTTLPDITAPKTFTETLPPVTEPTVSQKPTEPIPPVTKPTTPITTPTAPMNSFLNYSLCTVDADERAASKNWVCLNDYVTLLGWDRPYLGLFENQSDTSVVRMNLTTLSFSRPVKVCGVELIFAGGALSLSDEIQYGGTAVDLYAIPEFCADAELYSDHLRLPDNSLWLEPTTNVSGSGFGDFWENSTTLRSYLLSDSLVGVRIFGTLLPSIEEVRAPSDVPYDVYVVDRSSLPKYCLVSYYRDGEEVAYFKQSPIYGNLQLPAGSVELIEFAGRNVVRVKYTGAPDVYDLYWDDGEYRYQLWGTDEELLLKLAESIGTDPGLDRPAVGYARQLTE